MNHPYFPHTEEDIRQMMEKCGVSSLRELYSDVPSDCIYEGEYNLPKAMSELEVRRHFASLASQNVPLKIFAGAGAYDHYSPAVVPYILSRSEFSTAYTPYQAEISQGTLRAVFEWQSMICRITGMDVANASMYDGATSAAESMMMAVAASRKKNRFIVSASLLPQVLDVVSTYARFHGIDLVEVPVEDGVTSLTELKTELESADVAGVMMPGINRYGVIEDLAEAVEAAHSAGALFVEYCDPSAMTVLKTAGEWGADVACGDAQTLGMPLNFGGPYCGFMACRQEYMRKLPGRLVGETVDADGKRAFVLTLQAREQHIRREKATSNICSNQSLMALYATVYLSLMGPAGMRKVNDLSYAGAHFLKGELLRTGYFEEPFSVERPFLKEFVLRPRRDAEKLCGMLADRGFLAALPLGEGLVSFCVTEKHDRIECEELVNAVKSAFDALGGARE
ncbi:MAG: aminomethyl-transferring glycine dehydrogenase subunit GcvPA [Bacteroidales bacterium]|nr:aminomethyl-transferring glycine dehydrogenase subunit GcvPA [Bacteroidales bacterium]MDY4481162.1 aminomethyl-transferring glycine dehydrogenase subunit GcvPA [Candidatus Cryptobacteroides sp.]MDY4563016.1 aminomethyl-transferring glycine dehydrogenase subunit GcvPA [Candidatus Cryptobacteroides sp.]MDY6171260.1 aminomethyl-transferring glycine dehydrogenase subunit GcvPA [Candidatus Cryptobacteroides sp.]